MERLYHFIKASRNSYLSVSIERITKKLDVVQSQNNRCAEQLDRIETKLVWSFAKELNEIAGRISEVGSFPQRFTTIEQGEFALGYYFQRNHKKDNDNQDNINS